MTLADSGTRREFGTGAVRDVADGKGRCDLLPLGILGDYLDKPVLVNIENYLREGDPWFLISALNLFVGYGLEQWCTALLNVSTHYEAGAKKYSDRNWEKGIPVHCYIDSGVRHYLKYLRGDKDEPHDLAFIWNMLGAIWTHHNHPELIDLPFTEVTRCG